MKLVRHAAAATSSFAVVTAAALLISGASGACTSPPTPGDFGQLRFAGKVQGEPPLQLFPPVADANGNVYTLYGALDLLEVNVFVSRVGGGELSGNCVLSKGDRFGAHGWVGFAQDRVWYWSGDALVLVGGSGTICSRVLDRHPGTDVSLAFRAVLPWVRDAPSRTSLVAFVQSPVDPTPFSAMVDLNLGAFSNVHAFEPADATKVKTLGVGGDRDQNVGFVLFQYERGGGVTVEARFYDPDATMTSRVTINNAGPFTDYAVRGYLSTSTEGLVAGLLSDGRIIEFDKSGGRIIDAPANMTGVGVHVWEGKLWLVGLLNDRPTIAHLQDNGTIDAPQSWSASFEAAASLRGAQSVLDDRALPSRMVTWPDVRTAIGAYPFLSPFPLTRHADGTTLWVLAGPGYDIGGAKQTAFAMAPVGVSYP